MTMVGKLKEKSCQSLIICEKVPETNPGPKAVKLE